MKKHKIYLMIDYTIEFNQDSLILLSSWIEKEVLKLSKNSYHLDFTKISVILFNKDIHVILNLKDVFDFNLPKIKISSCSELNFKKAIEFLNDNLKPNESGIIFWIVNDSVYDKIFHSKIRDSLSTLKSKIDGNILFSIKQINSFSLTDYNSWYISSFIDDTFEDFIKNIYEEKNVNLIAV